MKGDTTVIAKLNGVLAQELISINQSFLHSRMLNNWGVGELGEAFYEKSICDMKQADRLIERILFLEGLPNLQSLGRLRIGEAVEEILAGEFALTEDTIAAARAAATAAETAGDYVSRRLAGDILSQEEERLDWLTAERELLTKMGVQNYIQRGSRGDDDEG